MSTGTGPLTDEVFWSPRQNRVWKPVVAAVNGLAAGAGLHFVVDADIVVASERASFMDTHVNVAWSAPWRTSAWPSACRWAPRCA
ncbi:enoyl-CoA hydratase-related protein [Yinghuangia aomiensis]